MLSSVGKSFEEWTPRESREMERLMAQVALRLATRPGRRRVPTRGTARLICGESFRRAVAHGGEFVTLARRAAPSSRLGWSCSATPVARWILTRDFSSSSSLRSDAWPEGVRYSRQYARSCD